MTKFYEVALTNGTAELINLSSITRMKQTPEFTSVKIGSEWVDVLTESLMPAFLNAEISVMMVGKEEEATA